MLTVKKVRYHKDILLYKLIHRYDTIPIKILQEIFFVEFDKLVLKFIGKGKGYK